MEPKSNISSRSMHRFFLLRTLTGLFVLVGTALALGVSLFPVGSDSIVVAQQPALSTPQLIERAFELGEITADQRLIYLTYAVYKPESLPAEYHSNVGWFGTAVVREIKAAHAAAAEGRLLMSPSVQAELDQLLAPLGASVCDREDMPNNNDSTNFHLNYETIGGGLTINNYTTSMEQAFSTEVTSYGWANPPLCMAEDVMEGGCFAANPWNLFPVQVANLGGGMYGYCTTTGGNYTGIVYDNPNTTATETAAEAGCCVLNSDFSQFGDAQRALNVTTAHEYNHAIQFGYGDPDTIEDVQWYESSSVHMEDEVWDAVNDNYQYLWPQFGECLGDYPEGGSGSPEYTNWLFVRYAAEHNGGTNTPGGGEDIMQAFWANVGAGQGGLLAYGNALVVKSANLNDTYHNYAIASRFMKTCPANAPYCYEEATGYLAAKGNTLPASNGSIDTVGGNYTGTIKDNYAINWVDLPISGGPYQVRLTNTSAGGLLRGSTVADNGGTLSVIPLPSVVGTGANTSIIFTPPPGATSVVLVITNQSKTADDPEPPNACVVRSYTVSVSTSSEWRIYSPVVLK